MIFRRHNISQEHIEIADGIIENQLFVHPAWKPINIGEIDWKMDPYNDGTWCFYLHSLDLICYLVNSYELTGKIEYLTESKKIIKSWINENLKRNSNLSPYAWKDHSVANRVVNFIHFYTHYKKNNVVDDKFDELLFLTLKEHGEYLVKDENHTFTNNHGIFQDRSLIALSVLFPSLPKSKMWYEKSIERFMLHVDKDVSKSGIHLEHSDAYHIIVFRLFSSIYEFLKFHEKEEKRLKDLLYKMQEFLAYVYKPDMRIPMNGDSGPDSIGFIEEGSIYNELLLYVKTKGLKGKVPMLAKCYKDAGTAFIRNNWKIDSKQLYFRIFAAYHSKVHKHADDLSFVLSKGKTNFFIDSGKYNYKEQDNYRKYFRSSMAHNSITVNNETYPIHGSLINKSKIIQFIDNDNYVYIEAMHKLFTNVSFNRKVLYLKEREAFIIYDDLKSNKIKRYSQIFNIGEDVSINVLSKNRIILESKIDKNKIELIQVNRVPEFKKYFGSEEPIAGWQSAKFNQKKPIMQLRFSEKEKNVNYKTIINTELKKGIKKFNVTEKEGEITFKILYKDNSNQMIKL